MVIRCFEIDLACSMLSFASCLWLQGGQLYFSFPFILAIQRSWGLARDCRGSIDMDLDFYDNHNYPDARLSFAIIIVHWLRRGSMKNYYDTAYASD